MAAVKTPPPPSRRDRARATRLRILHAAHALFVERGYTGTRMADVAERAGVAVQTVYFTFHTKAELLQNCYDLAVLGEDDPRPPQQQEWYRRMLSARSGTAALRLFASGNGEICARIAVLDDVTRSASHEPEAVAVRANGERLRRDGMQEIARHLDDRFGLRAGLDLDRATDVLLTLSGGAVYRALVVDYGWTQEQYVDWVAATLADQLLASRPRR
jgi:AcrR family transcriptional regulator